MKNEIFKSQLEEFKSIILIFLNKDDLAIRDESGLDAALEVNATLLYDDYARHRFNLKIDPDKRPYNRKDCIRSIVTAEYAHKRFKLLDGHVHDASDTASQYGFEDWQLDGFGMLSVPNKFTDYVENIKKIASNPLVPEELTKKLENFCKSLMENLDGIMHTLNDAQKEMVKRYPDV